MHYSQQPGLVRTENLRHDCMVQRRPPEERAARGCRFRVVCTTPLCVLFDSVRVKNENWALLPCEDKLAACEACEGGNNQQIK